jgi:hypothetical protein
MNKVAFIYFIADIILICISFFLGGTWLLNTQVAFICSILIVFASFISYKGMVEKKLDAGDFEEPRDLIDEIGDPHELFEEEKEKEKTLNKEEFQEIYRQEREKQKKSKKTFKNLFQSWSGALGIYRLLAYVLLFLAILILIRKGYFNPIAFIVGVSALPLATIISSFFQKKSS